jgi:hypothetical protein
MAAGNYFTPASPQVLAGLVLQSEARVRVGNYRLYVGSLDTTSALYLAYGASIGLVAGNSFDLGELSSLGLEHVPTFESPEAANVVLSSLQILTEEETTLTTGVQQFDPRILEVAVGTGVMFTIGNERLITVGGKCNTARRPVEVSVTNIGCNAPAAADSTLVSIQGIVITIYDAAVQNGLPWSEITATGLNTMELEWLAYPVDAKAVGNKLMNIYIY